MVTRRINLDLELLQRLYIEEHLGIDSIASRLRTSHGTVWCTVERYAIPRRNLSDAITKTKRKDFSGDQVEKAYLVVSCHTTKQEQIAILQSAFSEYGHTRISENPSGTKQILCYCNRPRLAQRHGSATGKGYKLKKDAWTISIASKPMLYQFCEVISPLVKHAKRKHDIERVMLHLKKV